MGGYLSLSRRPKAELCANMCLKPKACAIGPWSNSGRRPNGGHCLDDEQGARDHSQNCHRLENNVAKDKIRIVLEGLRGEDSIAELCRREGIVQNLYYRWSKDFLEAGK